MSVQRQQVGSGAAPNRLTEVEMPTVGSAPNHHDAQWNWSHDRIDAAGAITPGYISCLRTSARPSVRGGGQIALARRFSKHSYCQRHLDANVRAGGSGLVTWSVRYGHLYDDDLAASDAFLSESRAADPRRRIVPNVGAVRSLGRW